MSKQEQFDGYEFRTALASFIPDYSIDKDNYGQIIIYTGVKDNPDDTDTYVPMTDADFNLDEEE
jgi:hypothetical protein